MGLLKKIASVNPGRTWVWLQFALQSSESKVSIFVWDATREPSRTGGSIDQLLALTQYEPEESRFEVIYAQSNLNTVHSKPKPRPKANRHQTSLNPSLISSFATSGILNSQRIWPPELNVACELYLWMFPAHEKTLNGFGLKNLELAVETMAEFQMLGTAIISSYAEKIAKLFRDENIEIAAIASFLPEVAEEVGHKQSNLACDAIRFLIEFASFLQKNGHPTKTVELVAGSRLGKIQKHTSCLGSSDYVYQAPVLNFDSGLKRVQEVLRKAIEPFQAVMEKKQISIALELEPGPLYLLREGESLLKFCDMLDNDALLRPFVGINLDSRHFSLAGLTPDWVRENRVVYDRIIHGHCAAGHPRGHLSDICLSEMSGDSEQLWKWIELLDEFARPEKERAAGLPRFSGYVSLEFEAARSVERVHESAKILANLLQGM